MNNLSTKTGQAQQLVTVVASVADGHRVESNAPQIAVTSFGAAAIAERGSMLRRNGRTVPQSGHGSSDEMTAVAVIARVNAAATSR